MQRVLMTGAAGRIGTVLRPKLKEPSLSLRLCDVLPLKGKEEHEEIVQADLRDLSAAERVMKGMECAIHLAAIPDENTFENISAANMTVTYNVFEAARRQGVRRVIFASSNRVISFYPKEQWVNTTLPPRPDGLYAASKVYGEALGRLYADKYGLEVVCLRIGSFAEKPKNTRHLSTWISHEDMVQLVQCCIKAPPLHFLVVYGVSANTRNKWDNSGAELLGFKPQDNAEAFVHEIQQTTDDQFHGGEYCC